MESLSMPGLSYHQVLWGRKEKVEGDCRGIPKEKKESRNKVEVVIKPIRVFWVHAKGIIDKQGIGVILIQKRRN